MNKQNFLRRYLRGILSIIIILGACLLYKSIQDNFWQDLFIAIAGAGIVILIYEVFYQTVESKFIFDYFPLYNKLQSIGLIDIDYEFFDEDKYKKDLKSTKELIIVMNDGKNFLRKYNEELKERVKTTGNTKFILLNPESDFVKFLNKRNQKTDDKYYQNKIKDVIYNELKSIYQNKSNNHNIEIFIHEGFHPYAVVMCDKKAMVSMYRLSPGKDKVLHFLFENKGPNSEYYKIQEDINKLINLSTKIEF